MGLKESSQTKSYKVDSALSQENHCWELARYLIFQLKMKKVNKQCLLDTPRTVRVSEKTWQVIVRTRRP